jgi:hypothetical protein
MLDDMEKEIFGVNTNKDTYTGKIELFKFQRECLRKYLVFPGI